MTDVLDLHEATLARIATDHADGASVTRTTNPDTLGITLPAGTPHRTARTIAAVAARTGYPLTADSDTVLSVPVADLPEHPATRLPPHARATLDHLRAHPGPLTDTDAWLNLLTAITHLRFEGHPGVSLDVLTDLANDSRPDGASLPTRQIGPFTMAVIPDQPTH